MTRPLVALLTDFGTRDWYVAALKGVILSRCPEARLLDITHEVPPQDVIAGAFTLAAAAPWLPRGTVCVAVVDPGVGSDRPILAARGDGRYFVGPDNGLLSLSLKQAAAWNAVRLTNRRYWLTDVSRTFQGRDIMAPAAAHLASGGRLASLGPALSRVKSLDVPVPERHGRVIRGHVVHIDTFGNLITNLPASTARGRGGMASASCRYQRRPVRVVPSYAEGRPEELVALVNSLGLVELAIREGSAAWAHNAKRGDMVELVA